MRTSILTTNNEGGQILIPEKHIQGSNKVVFQIMNNGVFSRYVAIYVKYDYIKKYFKLRYPLELLEGEVIDSVRYYKGCSAHLKESVLVYGEQKLVDVKYEPDIFPLYDEDSPIEFVSTYEGDSMLIPLGEYHPNGIGKLTIEFEANGTGEVFFGVISNGVDESDSEQFGTGNNLVEIEYDFSKYDLTQDYILANIVLSSKGKKVAILSITLE